MWNTIISVLIALISGGVGAAIVKLIGDHLAFKREQKSKKEDRAALNSEERLKSIEQKTDAQSTALKFILYDRIRFLGQAYIDDGEIDFDDRRILRDMHRSYHDGLGGNGDLDILMKQVDALPLKLKGKGGD